MITENSKAVGFVVVGAVLCLLAACGGGGGGGTPGLTGGGVTSGTGGGQNGGGASTGHSLAALIGPSAQYFGTVDPGGNTVRVLTGPGLVGYSDVAAMAYDPGAGTLYGFLGTDNQLAALDVQSGGVTLLGPLAGGTGLQAMAFDTADGGLYGIDGSGTLVKIDPAALTATPVGTGTGHTTVSDLTYDASTNLFYAVAPGFTVPGLLFSIDPATGAGADIGPLPGYMERLAMDGDSGQLYGLDRTQDSLAKIDKTNGALTATFPAMAFPLPGPLEYVPATQRLYTVARYKDYGGNVMVAIDPASGAAAVATELGFEPVSGMAYDADSAVLYASEAAGGRLIRIDTATAKGSVVGPIGFADVEGLAWDPVHQVLYGIDLAAGELLRIDTATGAGTAIGSIGGRSIRSLSYRNADQLLYGVDTGSGGAPAQLVSIDPAGGTVAVAAPLAASGAIDSLAYDPGSDRLYGIVAAGNGVAHLWSWSFATAQENVAAPPLVFASAMTFDAKDGVLLADNNDSGALVRIDPASGTSRSIQHTGFVALQGLTYDPAAQRDYAVSGPFLVALDPATGSGTPIAALQGAQQLTALAYDSGGQVLYGYDKKQGLFVTIDPAAGTVAPLGGGVGGISAMAFDDGNHRLYAAAGGQLYAVDAQTGAATAIGQPAPVSFTDLAYDPGGGTLYGIAGDGGNGARLYAVDPATGQATPGQRYDYRIAAIARR